MTEDSNSVFTRIREAAAKQEQARVNLLRAIPTPELPPLKRQQLQKEGEEPQEKFGSITQPEAMAIAAITEVTGSRILVVGSSAADPDKVLSARARFGDIAKDNDGNTIPRPVSDMDFLIKPSKPGGENFDMVCALLQKHVIDLRPKEHDQDRADYINLPLSGDHDSRKPVAIFEGGKITYHSTGTDYYYTPEGGAVKLPKKLT